MPDFAVPAAAVSIVEAPCGAPIYGKDPNTRLAPASVTKIVTALVVMERANLNERVVANISAKQLKKETRSSVMGLEPGMEVSVQDLLYGLFLPSGNDAAIVLAQHVSGSVDAFVALMNQKATGLGMRDTHFSNPHGLDDPGLYSTTADMIVAGQAFMQDPVLAKIASTPSYTLEGGLRLNNGNKLLSRYPGAYGVKIGFTDNAKQTIVAAASRNGRDLYVAVFGSEDLYNQTAALLDWAFANTPRTCSNPG
jgi:D-alanyl-D-alanine carboxypeptidase